MIPLNELEKDIENLNSRRSIKFKELLKLCMKYFEGPRIKGSHHTFKTPWKGEPWINLQKSNGDAKDAKDYQVKQVLRALLKLEEQNYEKNL